VSDDLEISFERLDGIFDDPVEQATFARLWVRLGERILSRCADHRTGTRDYIKLPLHQLALGLATHWWTLLYEPFRPEEASPRRSAGHRIDSFVSGYVFPALGVWSAGAEALTIETGTVRRLSADPARELTPEEIEVAKHLGETRSVNPRTLSRAEFTDETRDRVSVSRGDLETGLFDIVANVVDWIGAGRNSDPDLSERWGRIVVSLADAAERNYCTAAGRLGFDPYDPDTPDISVFAAELPEESFDDLCEAARFDELSDASAWLSQQQLLLGQAPAIDLAEFGERPALDPARPAWDSGYRAAIALRQQLSLDEDPRQATRRLIGDVTKDIAGNAPPAVEGLLFRHEGCLRTLVKAQSSAQWRFRECRAAYLGWGAEPGSYPLLTTAATHRQQASRAFAAELLCPADYLRHAAGRHGLTTDQITEIAEKLDCQTMVVEHQARNHRIAVRGID